MDQASRLSGSEDKFVFKTEEVPVHFVPKDLGSNTIQNIKPNLYRSAAALQENKKSRYFTSDSTSPEHQVRAQEFMKEFTDSVVNAFSDICQETGLTVTVDDKHSVNLTDGLIQHVKEGMKQYSPDTKTTMQCEHN